MAASTNVGTISYIVDMETDKLLKGGQNVIKSIDMVNKEFAGLEQQSKKLRNELKTAGNTISSNGVVFDKFGKINEQATKELAELTRQMQISSGVSKQLNTHMTAVAGGVKKATSGMGKFGNVMGQAGFQIQDAVTQISMGTNALSVLGIQGAQLAGAFGPGGAVLGAVIALAGVLGATLVGAASAAGDEIDYLTAKVDELGEAGRKVAARETKEELDRLKELAKSYQENLRIGGKVGEGITSRVILSVKGLEDEQAAYEQLQQAIKKAQERLDELNGVTRTTDDQLKKERDVIAELNNEYKVLGLQVTGDLKQAQIEADKFTASQVLGANATKKGLEDVLTILQAIRREREKLDEQQQAQQEQQQGLSFAESVITRGMTPAERREQDIARLEELRQQDIANEAVYQQAITSLKDKSAQEQADIERRKNDMILSATGSALNSSLDILRKTAGEQSGIYKAMFVASKAFAIAESIIKIQQGIANAAALPFPANIPAMATVAAATAGIVSTIQGTDIQGRRYGGPVAAGRMYEVNEGGRPEMLTMGNKQYLMPSSSGKVTSNRDMMQGGGVVNNINITTPPGMSADTRSTPNASGGQDIDVMISAVAQDIEGRGRVHSAITRATTAGNRQ